MNWRKSTTKCNNMESCVEVAIEPGEILVRNSNIPGEQIWFTPDEWEAFVAGVKNGEFDLA